MSTDNATSPGLTSRWGTILSIVGIVALLLHWFASFSYSNWLWGFNHYFFLPSPWTNILLGLGCILCLPWIALRAVGFHEHLSDKWTPGRRTQSIVTAILASVMAVLFWLLRSHNHFLGDGNLLIRQLEAGSWFHPHETLDRMIHYAFFVFAHNRMGLDAESAYSVLSVGAGCVYVIASMRLGLLLGQRFFVPALLLTLGTVELFMGYVESYSLATAVMLVYIVLALEHLSGKRRLIWPAVALALGIALHHALVFMIPSILVLFLVQPYGSVARPSRPAIRAGIFVLIVAGILSTSLLAESGALSQLLVPLSSTETSQYTLISLNHLVDLINAQMLITPLGWIPAALLTIAFLRTKSLRCLPKYGFLAVLVIMSFAYILLLRPGLGGSRDWDLWSFGFTTSAIAGVCYVAYALRNSKVARYSLYIILVVGFFHILPWITVNHGAQLSLAHFKSMVTDNPLWTDKRIAAARAELAWSYAQKNDYAEAINQIEQSVSLAPGVGRYWRGLGSYYFHVGRTREAEACLLRAIDLDPEDGASHSRLGQLYLLQGRDAEGERFLMKAIRLNPDLAHAHFSLGVLYQKQGNLEAACGAYQRAVDARPDVAQYWAALARCLGKLPSDGEAEAWKHVLRLTERRPADRILAEEARMNLQRLSPSMPSETEPQD